MLDIPKEEASQFIVHLTVRRDAWFVQVADVGIVYLSDIVLGRDANITVLFWDQGLSADRLAVTKSIVSEAFERFQLPRISARIPYPSVPMKRFMRDVGFVLEGTIRQGWSVEPPVDTILFGMLFDERPWPFLPLPNL